MTIEEIAQIALSRATQYTDEVSESRALLYARIGQRQQELFAMAGRISPDYFGVCATGALVGGALDLADIADPVPTPELIQRIEIEDRGTSAYASGAEVAPVALADASAAFPPRVTLRNRVLRQVGTDLAGVVSLCVHYSRIPAAIPPTGGSTAAELPAQYQMLLAIDAERDLYRRGVQNPVERQTLMARATTDEEPLLQEFVAHVAGYAGSIQTRFGTQTTAAAP